MTLLGKPRLHTPLPPLEVPDTREAHLIVDSCFEAGIHELTPYGAVMVGSAALLLHGIDVVPAADDPGTGQPIPRGNDIDFATTALIIEHLERYGSPTGKKVTTSSPTGRDIIATIKLDPPLTTIELKHNRWRDALGRPRKVNARHDKIIDRGPYSAQLLGNTGIYVASRDKLYKMLSSRKSDPKAQVDLAKLLKAERERLLR